MIIEQIEISKLTPADYNPRKLSEKQFGDIRDSLEKFGFVDPVIVNKDGTIVGGHMRLKVWESMGNTTAPVFYVDLTKDLERELNIRLNKNTGEFDMDILEREFDVEQLKDWGFEDFEIKFDAEEIEETRGEDSVPENAPSITVKGDLYEMNGHRLLCGDSTMIDDVDKLMNGKKADMLFTDPPYGVNRDKGFGGFGGFGKPIPRRKYSGGWDENRPEKCFFDMAILVAEKSIIFGGNFFADILPIGNHWIVWDKKNTMPTFGDCELAWTNIKRNSVKKYEVEYNGLIGKEKDRFHPTQKPVVLYEKILNDYSSENELIVDLFGGSGTTVISCDKTGRISNSMELDEHYCDVIVKRYVDYCKENGKQCTIKRNGEICNDFN